jgi:hypothetical protein
MVGMQAGFSFTHLRKELLELSPLRFMLFDEARDFHVGPLSFFSSILP